MSAEVPARGAAGSAMARWSAKALLITAGVLLVGGAIWYARSATIPLIVAALISNQLLPLIGWAATPRSSAWAGGQPGRGGAARGRVGVGVLGRVVRQPGRRRRGHQRGRRRGGVWLRDNNDWVRQHEDAIRDFLKSILPAAKDAADGIVTGVLGGLSLTAQLVSGALLVLVFLLYLLTGRDAIWGWIRDRFSAGRRARGGVTGRAAWNAASG
jgi:predicted PurR-regulated permease PerM